MKGNVTRHVQTAVVRICKKKGMKMRDKLKKLLIVGVGVIVIGVQTMASAQIVTDLKAQQRYPWNGLVDIVVTLTCTADDLIVMKCLFAATNSATMAAIPISHIIQNEKDMGSGDTWTRSFIWDAKADIGSIKINDVVLTVDAKLMGVQLWEDGPYWAECNVGAAQPDEFGYYFWWGDAVGCKPNSNNNGWISVGDSSELSIDSKNCPTYGKSDSQLRSSGYIDFSGNLMGVHDAARAYCGAPWRMPTDVELDALISNCDTEWTMRKGVWGRLVKGRGVYSSNSIFLPAAGRGNNTGISNPGSYGFYWSSKSENGDACRLNFTSTNFSRGNGWRYSVQPIRPVRGPVR